MPSDSTQPTAGDSAKAAERADATQRGVGDPLEFRKDGHTIHIDNIAISKTYAGLLEGIPDRPFNDRRRRKAFQWIEQNWGRRAVVEIAPRITPADMSGRDAQTRAMYDHPEYLPRIRCIAWLSSFTPIKRKSADGSQAFVIWYQDRKQLHLPLAEMVAQAIADKRWKDIAHDYEE